MFNLNLLWFIYINISFRPQTQTQVYVGQYLSNFSLFITIPQNISFHSLSGYSFIDFKLLCSL